MATLQTLIESNAKQASPTKFKGSAAIEDCMANKLIKGDVLTELNQRLTLNNIEITDQNELEQYIKQATSLGLGLLFDSDANLHPWLINCLNQLGIPKDTQWTGQLKKALLDVFLFQAVEMQMVKYYGSRKDIYELRTNARKTYKNILGHADRKSGTKLNTRITFASLFETYYQTLLPGDKSTTSSQSDNDDIPEFFEHIFPILIHDNLTKSIEIKENDSSSLKSLLINTLLKDRAFDYILTRNKVVDIDITDGMSLEGFVENNIRLGLELFFDSDGNCQTWFNRILTRYGFKSGAALPDNDKKVILDGFLHQAVDKGIERIFSNLNIDDFYIHSMHARQMRKEMLGIADHRTQTAENSDLSFAMILDNFTGSQF